jgi:putative transposase
LTLKNGRWYATFECHCEIEAMPLTGRRVGIDRGVRVLAATSDGELIRNPRHADRLRSKVERHAWAVEKRSQRDTAGRLTNRRDPARTAAVRRLARAKEREGSSRRDWLHKVSRRIVDRYDLIVLEDLSLRAMTRSARGSLAEPGRKVAAKSGLNRALLDAGFGALGTLIREKAEWAARVVIGVEPRYSSQTCAVCGHIARESRKEAHFCCVVCGHEADADVNAARVILLRAESPPTRAPGVARGRSRNAG